MKNKPLTSEQIRQMDGKPIWIDRLKRWGIVDGEDESVHVKNYGTIDIETFGDDASDYENTLVAYPYKPMHIDRESWKPCEECVSCSNCKNQEDYDPYEGILGECAHCYCHENFEPYNFCHECGRPLVDKAWDVLEKRISVGE